MLSVQNAVTCVAMQATDDAFVMEIIFRPQAWFLERSTPSSSSPGARSENLRCGPANLVEA
jgi:hypothetical protein